MRKRKSLEAKEMLTMFTFLNYSPLRCAEEYVEFIKKINDEILHHQMTEIMKKEGHAREAFLASVESGYCRMYPSKYARKSRRKYDTTIKDNLFVVPTRKKEWEAKFCWLNDYLIRNAYHLHNSKSRFHKINSRLLIRVVGEDYAKMLDMLCSKGLIHIPETKFDVTCKLDKQTGNYNRRIRMSTREYELQSSQIERYSMPVEDVKKYIDRMDAYFLTSHRGLDEFLTQYQQKLTLLEVARETDIQTWLDTRDSLGDWKSNEQKEYYRMLVDEYKNPFTKNRVGDDWNKRINSILTRTPKDMKCFLNKKFEVDIRNCHPLLANVIFDDIVRTSQEESSQLRQYIVSGHEVPSHFPLPHIHSVKLSELVRKLNKDDKLNKELKQYKTLTEEGLYWKELLKKYPEEEKSTIKEASFKGVFYGKFERILDYKMIVMPEEIPQLSNEPNEQYYQRVEEIKKHITEERNKYKCAAEFRDRFPSIWKVLRFIRKYISCDNVEWISHGFIEEHEEKPRTWLANALMRIESSIIRYTLQQLWDEGYKVLNIHDSIFVLDVPANQDLTAEHVKETLLNTLSIYGLKGEVKIEY